MDFTKLRATALKDGDDEEAVTVNTRALIDKVLARYSGEWTTLRELIQNAADAQATSVTIKFETLPSSQVPLPNTTSPSELLKHVLLNHTLRRLLVTNNGQPFGTNDWARLKRIAEGNPDETKIGAFGVGFYSVFADCEEPFVSSGDQAMAFYWKGNSLFTRRLQLPPDQGNPDTSFVLDYRNNTTPMPNLLSIAQFLATSLTFVALQNIELWVDDSRIIALQKKAAPSVDVSIARDVETKTQEGLMQVKRMERESVQMDATFMNVIGWKPSISSAMSKPGSYDSGYGSSAADVPSLRSFFSRLTASNTQAQAKSKALKQEQALQEIVLEDLTATTSMPVFLRVTTATIKTNVSASFAAELERATKKPPPKTTKLAILTSSYDETAASTKDDLVSKHIDIFASVLPGKKPGGRIFIGFPTHQTTGAGMHLSAPSVIPTVERESIDLNARWVRTWNIEMLRVAGIMARLGFSNEMADLSAKIKRATEDAGHGTKIKKAQIEQFMPEALHTLQTFTFGESTPSSQVAQIIEQAFWTAYKRPSIEIYSTRGVLPTTQVRLATEDLSGFVEGIPVVPEALVKSAFVNKLQEVGLIVEITIGDVKQELEAKALNKEQLIQFITWAGRKAINGSIDGSTIHSLMNVAVATVGEEHGGVIALGSIKNYLSASKIPPEVPLPPTTIPFEYTRDSPTNQLQCLGWEPLEIVPWLRFLIETNGSRSPAQSLTSSVPFAAHILQILSKGWDGLSSSSKMTVVSLLEHLTVVPTKLGMKKPGEAFFPNVRLFDDLPVVSQCPGVKEKFLAAIGVRKTVDLETIFSRLLSSDGPTKQGDASRTARHMELIKYLASVRDDIPTDDMKRLKGSAICPAEAGPKGLESTMATSRLYKVIELFEPQQVLRDLQLPILQWPGPPGSYRSNSVEGRFLSLLGLRSSLSVPELIDMMASADSTLRMKAMAYFLSNHHINGYANFNVGSSPKKFLPLDGDENTLVSPAECFTNERCSVLGFKILSKQFHLHANKFGVAMDPPITECVNRLIASPPRSRREAITLFGYFSSRLGEIGQNSVAKLSEARIVPLLSPEKEIGDEKSAKQPEDSHITPLHCYLGKSSQYSEIFNFVDFGGEANTFLMKCGSKYEPTTTELAALACKEPARLLGIMQSPDRYLNMLRSFANELPALKRDKFLFKQMKSSKFLLGSMEIVSKKADTRPTKTPSAEDDNQFDDELEEAPIKQFQLAIPSQIVIVDEYPSYQLFKGALICAPMEEKLEDFYLALGASPISSLIEDSRRFGPAEDKQASAVKLRALLLERAKLFLYESPRESIKHDERWLEKSLSIKVVRDIKLTRSLRGYALSHTAKKSADIEHERYKGWTLYIVPGNYDFYQISISVTKLLLERPSPQSFLTFESFLNLNLLQLRTRGYNVERILRAKAAEARIAEDERRKQLEAEQKQLQASEKEWNQQREPPATPTSENRRNPLHVPGSFSDSPENTPDPAPQPRSRGIFSSLTRRLGMDNSGEAQQQLQNFLGGSAQPPPQAQILDNPPTYDEANKNVTKQKSETEQVSSPHAVQQNLLNAIQSSRAHDSATLFSPPTTQTVKEQATYCDSTPSQNISFLAESSNGTRIFTSKTLSVPSSAFLATNSSALNAFAVILHEVADVYKVPRKALHIFYDESGGTIAFNSNGSIFCNFRFFTQLHEKKVSTREGKTETSAYWWIVLAHELAHNLVKEHNSQHSFYTEMLVANYFPKMMVKAAVYMQAEPGRREQASLMD